MSLADPPRMISAAPTVRIAEQSLPLLSNAIRSLRVTEKLGGLSSLELSVFDTLSFADGTAGWGATANSPLQLGASIKIYTGETNTPREIFDGLVTGIEGDYREGSPPLFTVLAEDRLWKARRKRRSRIFENASPADIVRRIASDHGLTPEIRDGLDSPTGTWAQINESDLAFMRRILARFDCDLQCVDDKLQAGARAKEIRAAVPLLMGSELSRARITADLADQATSVRVGGWDTAAGEAVAATVTSGEMGPGAGTDGASVLRDKFDAIVEHVGDSDALTSTEGTAMARALYGQRARRFVRVDAAAQGNPELRVGTKVTITGVNPFFVNDYSVVEAVHRYDLAAGYITEFIAEGAYLGAGA
jgi:phage protein D